MRLRFLAVALILAAACRSGPKDLKDCLLRAAQKESAPAIAMAERLCREAFAPPPAAARTPRAELSPGPNSAAEALPPDRLEPPSAADRRWSEQEERTRRAARANRGRLPPERREEFLELEDYLLKASQGGQAGVTPEMAGKALQFLQQQQGGVSVEMRTLLESVSRDGADLTGGTMRQLNRGARQADAQGLELGLPPELEKMMLDPASDPPAAAEIGPPVN